MLTKELLVENNVTLEDIIEVLWGQWQLSHDRDFYCMHEFARVLFTDKITPYEDPLQEFINFYRYSSPVIQIKLEDAINTHCFHETKENN